MDVIQKFFHDNGCSDTLLDKYTADQINEISQIVQGTIKDSYEDGVLCNYAGLYIDKIQKNITQAKKYYEIASEKGDFNAMFNLSIIYSHDKNYTESQKYLELAKQAGYGDMAHCHNSLGNTNYYAGKLELAVENYIKALEYPSSCKDIYYSNLASTYYDLNKYDLAIENYKKVPESRSDSKYLNIDYYNRLANSYIKIRDYKSAIDHYKKAIELSKGHYIYYGNLGYAYDNTKQHDLAIENYQKAAELTDDDNLRSIYLNNLGNQYHIIGRYELALDYYMKAQLTHSSDPVHFHNLGNTYTKMGKHELAIEFYIKALEKGHDASLNDLYTIKTTPLRLYHILNNLENKTIAVQTKLKSLQEDYTIHCYENKKRLLTKQETCPICYEDKTVIPRECAHYYCLDCYVRLEKCGICLK